ncbi:MAG: Ca-activated chloride channel family protein [Marivirga sp.]|jgi:Ca-activated chloride channel family protein
MTWINSLGSTDFLFIAAFILFYGAYAFRYYRVARALGQLSWSIWIKFIIRTAAFALLIMAALGPSFGADKKEVKSVGKDIMIAVDLSQSMNAYDIAPSRLEKIKFELNNIVDAFSSDRIGLLIFSSEAFVQCPLTYDINALNLFIETLNTGLVPSSGTNFSAPLNLAYDKITDEENGKAGEQKSKIIILISDGEDFGDDTDDIVGKITEVGIRLFTLGVGTEKGSRINIRNGFKRNNSGDVVVTKLNSESLKELAYDADGEYFEINNLVNETGKLIATINSIEGELRDTRVVDVSANKYVYFLLAAIALLLIDALWQVKLFRL